ncbi:MAG: DegT/DnrJ/EryC1/StrS family aminotransferase, partial [Candidatus Heimdallarchaeaceae archaeon]
GKYNAKFEKMLSDYFDVKHAALFNSGTSALHASLLAYNIENNEEIIVPSFTFISTANAVKMIGAKPVFADIEEETLGLDPSDVIEKITDKTKAILPVHYAGSPCKIDEIREIAEDHNLLLIEDVAESFGAKIDGRKAGTFGDSSMLSFCQNKIITTGEGGAIITNSDEHFSKLKKIRSHGRTDFVDYFSSANGFSYDILGYNFRLANILAALGVAQMKKVEKLISMRREKANYYTEKLEDVGFVKPFLPPENYFSVFQIFTVFVEEEYRNKLIDHLKKQNIASKIYFEPIHKENYYTQDADYKSVNLPITEQFSRKVLSLPFYPSIPLEQIDSVIGAMKQFEEIN